MDNNNVESYEVIERSESMLTLIENPFDYFTDFHNWLMFDIDYTQKHNLNQNCCEYLDRIVNLSDDMTQKERDEEIERAIDEIILYNPLNIYKKVKKNVTEYQ